MDKLAEIACAADIDNEKIGEVVYDYMKYPNNKKKLGKYGKLSKSLKSGSKSVSFKRVVEIITFTETWKMQMIESELCTEEEQVKRSLTKRNY